MCVCREWRPKFFILNFASVALISFAKAQIRLMESDNFFFPSHSIINETVCDREPRQVQEALVLTSSSSPQSPRSHTTGHVCFTILEAKVNIIRSFFFFSSFSHLVGLNPLALAFPFPDSVAKTTTSSSLFRID